MIAMKNDFAPVISDFLGHYLPDVKGSSQHTISSYSDTFRLLLEYCQNVKGMKIERMSVDSLDSDIITSFLEWLESERNCKASTRNQRLAAIDSFFRYAQVRYPAYVGEIQKILSIPFKKKEEGDIPYIKFEDMKKILTQPDTTNRKGRRDQAMLLLLYDTGARVSELINIRAQDIRLDSPAKVILRGKGRKIRNVPLMDETRNLISDYMIETGLSGMDSQLKLVFSNQKGEKFTRAGISYIINKYVSKVRLGDNSLPEKVTPHIFRHSKAMHLLQAGVNIVYIKDILGHADITTTQVYLKADMDMKEKALNKAKIDIRSDISKRSWTEDKDLLEWLSDLGKTKS